MNPLEAKIAAVAFTVFLLSTLFEYLYWNARGEKKFELRDSVANYALVFMQMVFDAIGKALFVVWSLTWVRSHGLGLELDSLIAIGGLFIGVDFGYYWFHRASHRIRVLWAIHVSHHSSELMNFTTALRQPPLEHLVDWLFFLPLAWLGYRPEAILIVYGFNLIYQFFIHTELVNRFPRWVEFVFNTPSHHRAHHGTNPQYIDMNYAGVFIIWDRLFGTFVEEREPVKYGILHPVGSYNPFYVGFHLWKDIYRDLIDFKGVNAKLRALFSPPDWPERYRAGESQSLAVND